VGESLWDLASLRPNRWFKTLRIATSPSAVPRLPLPVALVLLALMLFSAGGAQAATCPGTSDPSCSVTGAYGNTSLLGDQGQNILRQPQAVDLAGGSIYVGDRWGWHVQRFDSSHNWADQWGEYGTGAGQFTAVGGVAHDSAGNIYVLDIANNRVEKFDSSHNVVASWGGKGTSNAGSADFNISFKGGIAVDGSSYVYVSDTYNHRVVKFDTSGNYLRQLGVSGVSGSDNSHFLYPQGLTVDSAHNLYIADDQNDRIQKFDSSGGYLATIGSSSTLNHPYDVGVDGAGYLYVADNLNHRIDKFSPAGAFVKSWGGKGTAPGRLQTPRGIAVDSAGNNFVADTNNERMQEFDSNGNLVTTSGTNPWGLNGRDGGRLSGPEGLDVRSDKLVIADTLEYWIQELSPSDGSFIAKFGGHGTGSGQFELPADVAMDGADRTDVADTSNNRVQQFDSSNNYIGETGGFSSPAGVAVDGASNFYVADTGHNRVQEFSPSGTLLRTWTTFGASDNFSQPGDVAVSPTGDLYVADTGHNRIVMFDSGGNFVRTWDVTGASPSRPSGIEVDGAGNVYVADPGNGNVHKYDPTGSFLLQWGQRGHAIGEFWTQGPNYVTADASGNVYVSDTYNNRVEKFTFGAPSSPPTNTSPPTIPGTPQEGNTLTADPGSWSGSPTSYQYQWRRCDSNGENCSDITGATATSYKLTSADVNETIRVRVIASNAAGPSSPADSAPTLAVQPAPTGQIQGTVTQQSRTKPPIAGATVDCGGGNIASTDQRGFYTITAVPAGAYICIASANGYRSKSQSVTVTSGHTTTADFTLRRA
jgi:tripartite motif-containing protein 71